MKSYLLLAGFLTNAISWLLPVVKDGTTLAKGGVPGWEAFRIALSPIIKKYRRQGSTGLKVSSLSGGSP